MKMLARAPTKWLGTMFAVSLFLSVCLLLNPLKANAVGDSATDPYYGKKKPCTCSAAGKHPGSCGCNGDPKLKYCWYRTWDQKCGGHRWDRGWVTAVGDCTHSAGVIAYCGLCGQNLTLVYPPRQHDWGAWTDNGANNHIHYCKNTSNYTIDVGNNVGTITVYNKCTSSETQPHSWSSWVDFNPAYYRNLYPDLNQAFGNNYWALWSHWIDHGRYEGRVSADGAHHRWCWTCQRLESGQHTYGSWRDNGDGRHVRNCTVCGHVEYENHKWSAWSDYGDGRHVRHCTVCGHTEYEAHTYGDIKLESSQSSSHDKTVTYSFGCTKCPRREYVKLTLHVSGSGEKGTESSRYKRSGTCPVSESPEYYTGTGTAEFWLDKKGSASYITTNNKIVSQSVSIDELTGDRTSKNASDKVSGNSNTFTWNKDEGVRYFRYTMTDLRGHTYSIATDFSYLLHQTPPQISVSVDLPGQVSGNRTNKMAWTENAATMNTGQSPKPESAWSNKASPTIAIQCTTHDLNNPAEEYDHMKEIRLYKKTKDRSGNETTALLQVWNNVRSAVYTIPKGREGVIVGSQNPYGEGTGTYYVVAIDDLNRRAINYGSCPETINTKDLYNRLNGNNDYDYGLHNFSYDVNHVTVTPLTVHLDYTNPKIKDLTGNNPDNKGENRIVKSVLQFRASDNDYGYANSVNDNSDLSSVTLYGFTSDKQKHTIASYSRNGNDPFLITMPNNIGAFTLSGEGAVWIGGSDTKTLSPNQILSLSFPSDPYLSRQTSTTGSILLDCSRTPGLSNIQYESYSIEVYDRAGNKGVVNNIRTTQALVNELHTTIDRSGYK